MSDLLGDSYFERMPVDIVTCLSGLCASDLLIYISKQPMLILDPGSCTLSH